jgi:hypothetical protein
MQKEVSAFPSEACIYVHALKFFVADFFLDQNNDTVT